VHAHKERPEWGSVYARNKAMKDVFVRLLKKTAVHVCTLNIMHCHLVSTSITFYAAIPASREFLSAMLTGVYFRKLKINYDIHEFILDPGTIMNTKFER
jgi:hypothetical protein